MDLLHNRRDRIDRIEVRIGRLRARAGKLLDREGKAEQTLVAASGTPATGRVRTARTARRQKRAELRLQKLRSKRERLVEEELQQILVALQEQSQKTRTRLDRELSRLEPIEQEWDRLRGAFDELDSALATPGLEQQGGALRGELAIPEFPVREREGYTKPFPQRAMVF